ncbi:hypothetical protein B9S64_15590 [Streptomyces sp. SM18]|nr:hypothetical protein B9S64_15590 [Streptomyces sp. SM18]
MIRGHQSSRSSPDRRAGTRTKFTRSFRRPGGPARARSASVYSGSSTRSWTSAAPTNQSTTR